MTPQSPGELGVFALATLILSLVICLRADWLGRQLSVMDIPDAERKRHAHPTPLVGGIAILVPLLVWQAAEIAFFPFGDPEMQKVLLLCGAGVAVMGFIDDQTPTYPLVRILGLLVFVEIAFVIDSSLVASMLHWDGLFSTPIALWAYLILMAVSVVGLVNATNMADGQDGIVTGMLVIWSLCLWLIATNNVYSPLILLGASLIVFLFNLKGSLFLGNCGSYGATFVIAFLTISAHADGAVTVATIITWFFIPIADCLRLMISRRLQGRSPLSGDRDHFHHRLERKLGTHFGLVTYIGAVAITSLTATVLPQWALACIAALIVFYSGAIWLTSREEVTQIVTRLRTEQKPSASPTSVVRLAKSTSETSGREDSRPEPVPDPLRAAGHDAPAVQFSERKAARHSR